MEEWTVSGGVLSPPTRPDFCCRIVGLLVAAGLAGAASADVVDLTGTGQRGVLHGAIFEAGGPGRNGAAGDAIVRIQGNGVEQGYNTSGRPLAFDEKSHNTRDVKLGELGRVSLGGAEYYEFTLNVSEHDNAASGLISLDAVQIYVSSSGGQTTTNVADLGTLVYDMDIGGDNWVRLGTTLGDADMRMLIPVSAFAGAGSDSYVYLYSMFGLHHAAQGGYEEWRIGRVLVPLPPAVWAGGIGLALAAACRTGGRIRHAT